MICITYVTKEPTLSETSSNSALISYPSGTLAKWHRQLGYLNIPDLLEAIRNDYMVTGVDLNQSKR